MIRKRQTLCTPLIERHVHNRAYAALVLSGCYEEAGDSGRHQVQAGNVVLHEAFEAHLDRISFPGAVVLNVPLPVDVAFRPSTFRARARTRQAWRAIRISGTPLSEIAAHLGFADQAHMTRSVKSMTGSCPSAWRCACK